MIISNNGCVDIQGRKSVIMADLCVLLGALRDDTLTDAEIGRCVQDSRNLNLQEEPLEAIKNNPKTAELLKCILESFAEYLENTEEG